MVLNQNGSSNETDNTVGGFTPNIAVRDSAVACNKSEEQLRHLKCRYGAH